jgi:hypothetical protein
MSRPLEAVDKPTLCGIKKRELEAGDPGSL